jgi:hypothetical protein
MTRSLPPIPLLVLTAALLVPASAATAEPPTPVDSTPEVLAAGEACEFPISVVFTGKEGFIDLPNNPQFSAIAPAPGLKATVTNLDTGNTVTVNASGAFRFVEQPDGSTLILAGGHSFLYGEPSFGVTALATTGPITLTISPEGDFVAADLSRARVRDLCEELA